MAATDVLVRLAGLLALIPEHALKMNDLGANLFHAGVDAECPPKAIESRNRIVCLQICLTHSRRGQKMVGIYVECLMAISTCRVILA